MRKNACKGKCFQAQVSAESLLVLLIFLSSIGIIYASGMRLFSAAKAKLDSATASSVFYELASNLDSACMLGHGNIRRASTQGTAVFLNQTGYKSATFESKGFSSNLTAACGILVKDPIINGTIAVENNNGIVEIYQVKGPPKRL